MRAADLERLRQTLIAHFGEHLYHRVGLRDICREAGVSTKTVYKYFGSKDELLLACVEPGLRELTERTRAGIAAAGTPRAALQVFAEEQFRFYAEHPEVARIVFLNIPEAYWLEGRSAAHGELQVLLEAALGRVADAFKLPADAEITLLHDICSGSVYRIIVRWLIEGQRVDLRQHGQIFFDLLATSVGL